MFWSEVLNRDPSSWSSDQITKVYAMKSSIIQSNKISPLWQCHTGQYRLLYSLTSADFEGEINGTLLAPTSCLIGAMSVLVQDMYTWTTCHGNNLQLLHLLIFVTTYLIRYFAASVCHSNTYCHILSSFNGGWCDLQIRVLESSVWTIVIKISIKFNVLLKWLWTYSPYPKGNSGTPSK